MWLDSWGGGGAGWQVKSLSAIERALIGFYNHSSIKIGQVKKIFVPLSDLDVFRKPFFFYFAFCIGILIAKGLEVINFKPINK